MRTQDKREVINLPMGGYITWIAIAGTVLLAIVDFVAGANEAGAAKIAAAVAMLGIGRKIEK